MSLARTFGGALLALLLAAGAVSAQERPHLVITRDDARVMRESLGAYPLFDRSFSEARATVDAAIARPLSVPLPRDAGGPTHERHKKNYAEMQLAGVLYAVTGEERYARFVREMLLAYARLYPTLTKHPMAVADQNAGRLFWQTLNETVWLVHAAQAYDCVYDWIGPDDRRTIDNGVFLPMARFFAVEHRKDLDRIHNHGTWMAAAVGLLGYTLRDRSLVDQALLGSERNGTGGFLRQLDLLFSPDGYYAEGPYYARYALMPFYLFACAIEHNQPELKIFSYRDGILRKALLATLQLTNTNGEFFPFNDALKGMNASAKEMVLAVDVVYGRYGGDPGLLPVASRQNRVTLTPDGVAVARGLARGGNPAEFPYASLELRDGADGERGGIGVLRSGGGSALVMKYGSQGMGHGHFDRLNLLYYNEGDEVLQDYGAARWINIEPKFGGRYLPENDTWAKQTIAHNTVAVDGKSHFGGKTAAGEASPGERVSFSTTDPRFQVMSARAREVAPGVTLQRTVAMVRDSLLPYPLVIDLLQAISAETHTYDLPFYYLGQLITTSIPTKAYSVERRALGATGGYQHLWLEAEGKGSGGVQFTWLNGARYYTVTSAADSLTSVFFTRIGAGDPEFNLRNEPGVILRKRGAVQAFASVIEPHGAFDPVEEISSNARPAIESVRIGVRSADTTVIEIQGKNGIRWLFTAAGGSATLEKMP